jgi:hypothetical protein
MKPCPKCHISDCFHEKKIFNFALVKISLIQHSLDATVKVFSALATFLPTNADIQGKIGLTYEELYRCQGRINDIKRWYETKLTR